MTRDLSGSVVFDVGSNYVVRLRQLYETDVGRTGEFVLRNVIVITLSTAVALFTETWAIFVWLASYLSVIGLYAGLLTRKHSAEFVNRAEWRAVVALGTAACIIYCLLPLYLWTLPNTALKIVGVCGIFGMAMLNLTRHTFESALAHVDMAVVCGSVLFMGVTAAWTMGAGAESAMVMAGTIASAVYYGFAHHDGLVLRTRLLENERREAQAAKMQAVGQLTTGIAHDFNNILTVVIGNIELARLSKDRFEIEESLIEAHHAAERAGSLVSQLLAFSRRSQLRPVAIEPVQFAEAFARTMERLLPASITLRYHVSPSMSAFYCDRPLLDTALMNLVINARDAMTGRGNLSILIEETHLPTGRRMQTHDLDPGRYARIVVSDTGPGIPDDLLDRVAEPFFTTKSIGKGSGLGLAMVKGFSEQSGGGLHIASSPRGTDVTLYLPLSATLPDAARETVTGHRIAASPS